MTREEPRPDRLPQIRRRLASDYLPYRPPMHRTIVEDIAWLVAEVERLRAELQAQQHPESDAARRATIRKLQQFERGR